MIKPDATNASHFFAAAAVTGGRVAGLTRDSLQGDLAFLEVLQRKDRRGWPASTLAAIAPFAKSPVTIRGIAHARLQETGRVTGCRSKLTTTTAWRWR